MKSFLCLLLLLAASVVRADTPNEAAKAVLELVKAENYSELFRTRYTEWYKIDSEKMSAEEAITQLASRWKKQREMVLSIYTQLSTAEFTVSDKGSGLVSETGERATAKVTMGTQQIDFVLYRMKNGLWGFRQ